MAILLRPDKSSFEKLFYLHTNEELAIIYGVSKGTINKWISTFELTKRKKVNVNPTGRQKEIITGSLLGDGSLAKIYKTYNSCFSDKHCLKQKDYVYWKYEALQPFSNNIYKDTRHSSTMEWYGPDSTIEFESYIMMTIRHPIFTSLEKTWYARYSNGDYVYTSQKTRKKIIPKNITLTPLTLAVWYFDDGFNKPRERYAGICTDSFSKDECIFLCSLLSDLGIKSTMIAARDRDRIYIQTKSYLDFINLIKIHLPCESLEYKISTDGYTIPYSKRRK